MYGVVTDADGRPAAEDVKVSLRQVSEHFGSDLTGGVVLGARPSLLIEMYYPAVVTRGAYEVPGRRLPGGGLRGIWELGCGGPSAFIARDTVALEPYSVERKDIRC